MPAKKFLLSILTAAALATANADIRWPTPSKDFAQGKPPAEFLQPTVSGNPASGGFGDVRNNGYRFHEAIDIKPTKRNRRGEPLDDINAASAREKSIRHGHPSTLHLWWARRPLAAARAVIWSSLVDDPSAHPEEFPTAEDQATERERLFNILRELVVWETSNDERVLDAAKAEIKKSMGGGELSLLDPFAGGVPYLSRLSA